MPRISPLDASRHRPRPRDLAAAHEATGSHMTNMKWTLAHAPAALHALLEWYPLHDQVVSFLGERRATLFCHAISTETDCLICSTFFRRILIDAGEDPDARLDEHDELVVTFGSNPRTSPRLWSSSSATARVSSPGRASSSTPGCSPADRLAAILSAGRGSLHSLAARPIRLVA